MADELEMMLDGLAPGEAPPEPPEVFLRAVRRRRVARRAAAGAAGGGLMLLCVGVALLARSDPPPPPPGVPAVAAAAIPETAVLALTRINRGRDVDALVLPEPVPGPTDTPLRLGWRAEPEWVERWVQQ